jgi:hypothetical protein
MSPHAKKLAALTVAWLAMPFGIAAAQEPEPTAPEGTSCGGFAGTPCPDGYSCVDNPADDCDPSNGGADCAGVCSAASEQDDAQGDTEKTKKRCDYNDPNLQYVSRDPDQCAVIRFTCETGREPFFNECGCGCQPIAP